MKKNIRIKDFQINLLICLLSITTINLSFSQDTNGLGINGTTYFSPIKGGKNYYAAGASFNIRDEKDFFQLKVFGGVQFHELVKIIDIGTTFRILPIKNIYIGVSPYTIRISTLKETENSEAPVGLSKDFGTAHLGYAIPISENFKIELEGNYNYFYKSQAAGYGVTLGFVVYDDELLSILSKKL